MKLDSPMPKTYGSYDSNLKLKNCTFIYYIAIDLLLRNAASFKEVGIHSGSSTAILVLSSQIVRSKLGKYSLKQHQASSSSDSFECPVIAKTLKTAKSMFQQEWAPVLRNHTTKYQSPQQISNRHKSALLIYNGLYDQIYRSSRSHRASAL